MPISQERKISKPGHKQESPRRESPVLELMLSVRAERRGIPV